MRSLRFIPPRYGSCLFLVIRSKPSIFRPSVISYLAYVYMFSVLDWHLISGSWFKALSEAIRILRYGISGFVLVLWIRNDFFRIRIQPFRSFRIEVCG